MTMDHEEGITCHICGEWETLEWAEKRRKKLIDRQVCFSCSFWDEKVSWKEDGDTVDGCQVIRAEGQHYVVAPEKENNAPRGHGGRKFRFKMKRTGQTIEATNVWSQGPIPRKFRDALPDNAEPC